MMASDFWKMKNKTTEYNIKFPSKPKFRAMIYDAYDVHGEVTHHFTAAQVLQWHAEIEQSLRGKDLFAPDDDKILSSSKFKKWLRASFKACLKCSPEEAEKFTSTMTPHSFRAGITSELERAGVPRSIIKKLGRWSSDRAMKQYIRDGLTQLLRHTSVWRIGSHRGKLRRRVCEKQKK